MWHVKNAMVSHEPCVYRRFQKWCPKARYKNDASKYINHIWHFPETFATIIFSQSQTDVRSLQSTKRFTPYKMGMLLLQCRTLHHRKKELLHYISWLKKKLSGCWKSSLNSSLIYKYLETNWGSKEMPSTIIKVLNIVFL